MNNDPPTENDATDEGPPASGRVRPEASDSLDPVNELLAECLRAPAEEQRERLDEVCSAHPELAEALRERFDVLAALGLESIVNRDGSEGSRFGDYELLEEIGSGGMGIVHRARQVSLDREVVVKLIRPELLHFSGSRRRFEREATAIAQLQHPGVVPIHGVGEHEGVPYFAMELAPGTSLDVRLGAVVGRPQRSLRARDLAPGLGDKSWAAGVLDVACQIAAALHHAHQRGILHRDVKPSNVLLDDSGRAILIDFGLHTLTEDDGVDGVSRLTREGSAPGTLLYMAPEQLEVGVYDVRSEVYALGATLYELLAFEPPFRASDRSATERLIRSGGPGSIQAKNPAISRDVDAVIQRALSTDPARRYVDMHAFQDDLERLGAGKPVTARPDSTLYRLQRWTKRQPALAAVSAGLAVLTVATPATIIVQQDQHANRLQLAFEDERDARLEAEDLSTFVIDVLESADPNLSEPNAAVQQILDRGVARLDERLAKRPLRRADMQRALGRIHGKLGLGARGAELLRSSLATLEAHYESLVGNGASAEDQAMAIDRVIQVRIELAVVLEDDGRLIEAVRQRRVLLDEIGKLRAPDSWGARHARATWMHLAHSVPEPAYRDAFGGEARPTREEVDDALQAAIDSIETSGEVPPKDLGHAYGWLGSSLASRAQDLRGDERQAMFTRAAKALESSLVHFEEAGFGDTIDCANGRLALGLAHKNLGQLEAAEREYRSALTTYEQRLPPNHQNIGGALINVAGLLELRKKHAEAVAMLDRAAEILSTSLDPTHPVAIMAAGNAAGTAYRGGLHDGLIERYDAVLPRQLAAYGEENQMVAASYEQRADLRFRAGDRTGALGDMEKARDAYAGSLGAESPRTKRANQAVEAIRAAVAAEGR